MVCNHAATQSLSLRGTDHASPCVSLGWLFVVGLVVSTYGRLLAASRCGTQSHVRVCVRWVRVKSHITLHFHTRPHATTSRAGAPGVQAAVISYTPSAQTTVSRGPVYRHAQSPACVVSSGAPLARVSPHNTNCSTEMFFICLRGNDPSAGSPTETLLRLHLPLDGKV